MGHPSFFITYDLAVVLSAAPLALAFLRFRVPALPGWAHVWLPGPPGLKMSSSVAAAPRRNRIPVRRATQNGRLLPKPSEGLYAVPPGLHRLTFQLSRHFRAGLLLCRPSGTHASFLCRPLRLRSGQALRGLIAALPSNCGMEEQLSLSRPGHTVCPIANLNLDKSGVTCPLSTTEDKVDTGSRISI